MLFTQHPTGCMYLSRVYVMNVQAEKQRVELQRELTSLADRVEESNEAARTQVNTPGPTDRQAIRRKYTYTTLRLMCMGGARVVLMRPGRGNPGRRNNHGK